MDESVDAILELDERAEGRDLGDLALDDRADGVLRRDLAPRIRLRLLEAERNALLLRVHVEDDRLDLLALLEALRGMVDLARPAHVADVDHAVDALLELDERAVRREVADLALDLRADREAVLHRVPRIRLRLADAERDLLVLDVHGQNDDLHLIADAEHVGRARDALRPAELGDVHETLDAGSDFDERAVRGEIDDLAAHTRADRELVENRVPRILRRLLQTEAHALAVAVDIEHHDVELLPDLQKFARMLDAAPAHVRDVEKSVEAIQVDERAEIGDVLDVALADLALLEGGEELRLALRHRALDELTTRNDEIAALV